MTDTMTPEPAVADRRSIEREERKWGAKISETLAAIRKKAEREAVTRDDGYREAVLRVAGGEAVDADAVAELLTATGKTADQFEADVDAQRRRRVDAATAAQRGPAEAELSRLAFDVQAAETAKAQAVREHDERLAPLYSRQKKLNELVDAAHAAERRLQKTYTGPLRPAAAEAQGRARAAAEKIRRLQFDAHRCQDLVAAVTRHPEHHAAGEGERLKERQTALAAELAEAERQQQQAVGEWNAAALAMRDV